MHEKLYDEMHRVESRHWWFHARRRIVLALLEAYLPAAPSRKRVCDVGCGCGMMLCDLEARGYDALGVDASEKAVAYCVGRGVKVTRGRLPDDIGVSPADFDAVLLLDVLEHVRDDFAASAASLALLRPGGVLICTVPAHRWLWTKRDEFHHHERRYDRERLRRVVTTPADGRLLLFSYMNSFLFPLAMVSRLLEEVVPAAREAGGLYIPPLGINRLFGEVFASERGPLSRGCRLPFGLSLLAVVRKVSDVRREDT